jgi:transposase
MVVLQSNCMSRIFAEDDVRAMIAETVSPLRARVEELETENARLRAAIARLRKDSSTSSKPPSSDLVQPPKPPRKDGQSRKRGGQPGHEQHLRADFSPEAIDKVVPYTLDGCPDCGGRLRLFERPADVLQQVEITAAPTIVTEHRALAYWCPRCQALHCAPLPESVERAGLFGPRLTALVAFMKGVCHASFAAIRKFLRDVIGVNVSRGYLAKLIAKVSRALAGVYSELCNHLPRETSVNVDETGHRENRQKYWTWCFRAQLYTLFRIDKSRGSQVLVEVLGTEFNGVLGFQFLLDSVQAHLSGTSPPSLLPSGP